jgi:ribosome-associated protein
MQTIEINRQPVELYKILKFEGLVGTGGEAKIVIDEGMVKVNGQVELRRRNKIKDGDVIEFNNEGFLIKLVTD